MHNVKNDQHIQSSRTKRVFDILFSIVLLPLMLFPMLLIAFGILTTSGRGILYWSNRIGQNNRVFKMPKFRTMKVLTPQVASHLLQSPQVFLTPIGSFLRKTSLDELPQLYSILRGDLSFVGPRPALFNQYDLVSLREAYGVHRIKPGLTGWAQINGRDNLSIEDKVEFDKQYMHRANFWFDLKILGLTALKVMRRQDVWH